MVGTDHGRAFEPLGWNGVWEDLGPFQLAVLVLNSLRCLCGKCISEYQSGCGRVVNSLILCSHTRRQVVGEILSVFRVLTLVCALWSTSFLSSIDMTYSYK